MHPITCHAWLVFLCLVSIVRIPLSGCVWPRTCGFSPTVKTATPQRTNTYSRMDAPVVDFASFGSTRRSTSGWKVVDPPADRGDDVFRDSEAVRQCTNRTGCPELNFHVNQIINRGNAGGWGTRTGKGIGSGECWIALLPATEPVAAGGAGSIRGACSERCHNFERGLPGALAFVAAYPPPTCNPKPALQLRAAGPWS
eukprot:1335562-Rhodomonas_salina.2